MRGLSARAELRLFQLVVFLAALVPIAAGAAGMWQGAAMIPGAGSAGADLDSHFRYLSGLLLGIGIAFLYCAADIRRRVLLFRALGLIVIIGGLGRLYGAATAGLPGPAHRFALVMELLVIPALLLWLARIERGSGAETPVRPGS